jgi:hypothetical protein
MPSARMIRPGHPPDGKLDRDEQLVDELPAPQTDDQAA